MNKRIYVAGPISKGDLSGNIKRGINAAVELMRRGYAVYCPHFSAFAGFGESPYKSSALIEKSPCLTHQEWLANDLPWVAVSDAVLRLPGESVGADLEVRHAESLGIPVYESMDQLLYELGSFGDEHAEKHEISRMIDEGGPCHDGPDSYDTTPHAGEEFVTGSVRDSREGKGRFDLISPFALRRLALHFESGARKYGDRNWERGQPLQRYLDSALRHVNCHQAGMRDEDHLIAAAWNLLAHVHTEEMIASGKLPKSLDDSPNKRGAA